MHGHHNGAVSQKPIHTHTASGGAEVDVISSTGLNGPQHKGAHVGSKHQRRSMHSKGVVEKINPQAHQKTKQYNQCALNSQGKNDYKQRI